MSVLFEFLSILPAWDRDNNKDTKFMFIIFKYSIALILKAQTWVACTSFGTNTWIISKSIVSISTSWLTKEALNVRTKYR